MKNLRQTSLRLRPSLKDNFLKPFYARRTVGKSLGKFSSGCYDYLSYFEDIIPSERYNDENTDPHPSNQYRYTYSRPNINSSMINSIFHAENKIIVATTNEQTKSPPMQLIDNIAQKSINNYLVEKLKKKMKDYEQATPTEINKHFVYFMYTFSLSNFCKFFKCLNTIKAIKIDKKYIVSTLYEYFQRKKPKSTYDNEKFHYLKLRNYMQISCKKEIIELENQKQQFQLRIVKIKKYVHYNRLSYQQILGVRDELKKLENSVSELTARLARENYKTRRLTRYIAETKYRLRDSVHGVLRSGVFFSEGYGQMYSQIVEAGLHVERHILQSLLDYHELQYLRQKYELYKRRQGLLLKLAEIEAAGSLKKQLYLEQIQAYINGIRNQLELLEYSMIERISRLPDMEKRVFSIFGTGYYGQKVLKKVSQVDVGRLKVIGVGHR